MTTFIVRTWNVEIHFRPKPEADEAVKQSYQSKLDLLADGNGRLAPDVVALQEVGGENGEEPFEYLLEALGGSHPHRAISAFRDGRDIHEAFLCLGCSLICLNFLT
jgi:hypothetical protein